jgi:hypothetical protein
MGQVWGGPGERTYGGRGEPVEPQVLGPGMQAYLIGFSGHDLF